MAAALASLQLLDPVWQLRLAGALINAAPFPLLGLARLSGSPRTLLQELQSGWRRSRFGRSGRRPWGSSGSGGWLRDLGQGDRSS